jgi:hypothetical protein
MRKRIGLFGVLAAVALSAATLMAEGNWGPWKQVCCTNDVVVRFNRVEAKTYTWAFRNNSLSRTIESINFTYTYLDADTGVNKRAKDIMPMRLRPGQSMGGWTAFTANTRMEPTITITNIQYAN